MALGAFLSGIGPGAVNVLQALAAPQEVAAPAPTNVQSAQPQAPAKPRRSLLGTIGQVSDVLASVGGAAPLYQAGLDARQARSDMEQAKVLEAQGLDQERLGTVMQGVNALQQQRMTDEQMLEALPQLMQYANVSPERAAQVIEQVRANPQILQGLTGASGVQEGAPRMGLNVQYATAPDGSVRAYVPDASQRSGIRWLDLEGAAPTLPAQFVNTGGQTVGLNRLSGQQISTVDNTVRPDTVANNEARFNIAQLNADTQKDIANTRAETQRYLSDNRPSNSSKSATATSLVDAATPIVAGLRSAIDRLHQSGGMTDGTENALGVGGVILREKVPYLERFNSPAGFSARKDLDTLTTVGIPSLLPILGGITIGGKNIDAAKELQTWKDAIINAEDYPSALRSIARFEARMKYLIDNVDGQSAPAPRTSSRGNSGRPANVRAIPKTNSSTSNVVVNW